MLVMYIFQGNIPQGEKCWTIGCFNRKTKKLVENQFEIELSQCAKFSF